MTNEFQFNPKNVIDLKSNNGQVARMLLILEANTGITPAQLFAKVDYDFLELDAPVNTKEGFLGMVEAMRTEIKEGRQPEITELEKRQAWALYTSEKSDRLSKGFGWAR